MKTTKERRSEITAAATGDGLRNLGMQRMLGGDVVQWNEDGSCVRSLVLNLNTMKLPEASVVRTCCSTRSGQCCTVVSINS